MSTESRRKRIDKLLKMLKSAEQPVDEVKFRAMASYNLGVSIAKINEYLTMFYQMEVFEYRPEGLVLNE